MAIDWCRVMSCLSTPETPARGHVPIAPLVWNGDAVGAMSFAAAARRSPVVVRRQVWILDLYLRRIWHWTAVFGTFDVASPT